MFWRRSEDDGAETPRSGIGGGDDDAFAGVEGEAVRTVVEIPKGSRNKYEYDPDLGRFVLDRMLFSSVHYPADYGFIPGTVARDGDPVDVLVLLDEATFPGCVIEARPIGVFDMRDEKGPDEKILCVPVSDPRWNWIEELDQVPDHLLKEIRHFFEIYKDLEAKETEVHGWKGREEAWRQIRDGRERAGEDGAG